MSDAATPRSTTSIPAAELWTALAMFASLAAILSFEGARHVLHAASLEPAVVVSAVVFLVANVAARWIERRSGTKPPPERPPMDVVSASLVGILLGSILAVFAAVVGLVVAIVTGSAILRTTLAFAGVGAAIGIGGAAFDAFRRFLPRRRAPSPWRRMTIIETSKSVLTWTLVGVFACAVALCLATVDFALGASTFRFVGAAALATALVCAAFAVRAARRDGVRRFVRENVEGDAFAPPSRP